MTSFLLMAVLMGQVDYEALVMELRRLRDDTDVVSYLSNNAVEAQQISTLERNIERSLTLAREYRQRAQESRSRQQLGTMGMLAGDTPVGRMGQQLSSTTPDPIQFDIAASEHVENARDGLVTLVFTYRDIKARTVAQKQNGKPRLRSKSASQGQHVGGCEKDTDCKGDRLCERGHCVSPAHGTETH